jgi:hypothetical protein
MKSSTVVLAALLLGTNAETTTAATSQIPTQASESQAPPELSGPSSVRSISAEEWSSYLTGQPDTISTDWLMRKAAELSESSTKLLNEGKREKGLQRWLMASTLNEYILSVFGNINEPQHNRFRSAHIANRAAGLSAGVELKVISASLTNLESVLPRRNISKPDYINIDSATNAATTEQRQLKPALQNNLTNTQSAVENKVIATPSFSLLDDAIKKRTFGIDFGRLLDSIIKAKPPVKTEYETKDEFDARRIKWEKNRFYRNIGTSDLVAVTAPAATLPFVLSEEAIDYDAESEIMTVSIRSGVQCNGVIIRETAKPRREYVANNGFGAKVKVLVVNEKRECIEFSENGRLKSPTQKYSFKVQRRLAEETKFLMHIAIIGRVASPYAKVEESHSAPTMRFPIEKETVTQTIVLDVESIWLINPFSGNIFAKSASN